MLLSSTQAAFHKFETTLDQARNALSTLLALSPGDRRGAEADLYPGFTLARSVGLSAADGAP